MMDILAQQIKLEIANGIIGFFKEFLLWVGEKHKNNADHIDLFQELANFINVKSGKYDANTTTTPENKTAKHANSDTRTGDTEPAFYRGMSKEERDERNAHVSRQIAERLGKKADPTTEVRPSSARQVFETGAMMHDGPAPTTWDAILANAKAEAAAEEAVRPKPRVRARGLEM